MKSIAIQFAFVCLLFSVEARRKCAELEKSETLARSVVNNAEALPFQKEIENIFDAFNNNDDERVEELFKSLENEVDTEPNEVVTEPQDAPTNFGKKVIKYVPDRIKSEGYPSEVHYVQTADEYILQLHRIPYGRSGKSDKPRTPVYLMHGFLESSNGWIVLGPDNSLAYMLADAGYDVWMGNARGTENSCNHTHLKHNGLFQKEFWSYSWHEIGYYDLPASIDYILEQTNHKKLHYIGYSQGTTSFLVMSSTRPEYNSKIIAANLLAPVAYMRNLTSSMYQSIAHFYTPIKRLAEIMHVYKFTVDNKLLLDIVQIACRKSEHSTPLGCKITLSVLDSNQINCTSLPYILSNAPAGVSLRQAVHYIQSVRSGGFNLFDFDSKTINKKIYGSDKPPAYDLTKITVPLNLFYSKDDDTAALNNVLLLKSQLPNVKSSFLVSIDDFRHVDFIYSRYLRKAVNDRLINTINKANENI